MKLMVSDILEATPNVAKDVPQQTTPGKQKQSSKDKNINHNTTHPAPAQPETKQAKRAKPAS